MKNPRIRGWIGALGVLLALASTTSLAAQPSEKQVRTLMEVFGVGRMFGQMNAQMAGMMGQQLPCVPASYWNGFLDDKGIEELTRRMVPIYQRHFTGQEVEGLLKFYRSPLGRKVISEMPAAMAEAMKAGQQWGSERGQAMVAELQKKGTISGQGRCPAAAPAPAPGTSAPNAAK
ncbi:DUF2059 domain-containing protein [Dyella sp.]|jgi:hypothetical protein|uniref:DUF2059 domain-containing protein n=1 Tax=Dyella sp. TaxID=1869338 RepID=UPI002D76EBA6|nr:DUF2059 domain-containing protein [Dyella sp.]HET6433044.1 DUF2059 domain-containing protein [Dyella sp.]